MRATALIILAIVLFMAGLGASKSCIVALKDGDISSMGRRSTAVIRKERTPGFFWVTFSFHAVTAAVLFGGSVALTVSAFRGPKKR